MNFKNQHTGWDGMNMVSMWIVLDMYEAITEKEPDESLDLDKPEDDLVP